jgi:hypothetical protein
MRRRILHQLPRSRHLITAGALLLTALAALIGMAAGCGRASPTAPSGSTLVLTVNPTTIVSSSGTAVATATLRLPNGNPQPGAQVQFSSTLGTLAPALATTDNNGVAVSKLTGDGRIGMATVQAFSGAVMSSQVMVTIGAAAMTVTLQAVPATIASTIPTGGAKVRLLALVRDATGAPVAGAQVNFTTNLGRLASGGGLVLTNSSGEATDTLTVQSSDIGNATSIMLGVDAAGASGALVTATFTLGINTNAAASVIAEANPSSLPLGGGKVSLIALVRNSSGSPVPGAGVNFQTTLGTLTSGGTILTADQNGQVTDTLTIMPQTVATTASITASTPGAGSGLITSQPAVVSVGTQSGASHR